MSLKAIENLTLPLGWTGPDRGRGYIGAAGTDVYVDKHPDGSRTLLWRVRLLDYDCETGVWEGGGKIVLKLLKSFLFFFKGERVYDARRCEGHIREAEL